MKFKVVGSKLQVNYLIITVFCYFCCLKTTIEYNYLSLYIQNKPVMFFKLSTPMFSEAGFLGNPGMVITSPQTMTINSAPAAKRISLMGTS